MADLFGDTGNRTVPLAETLRPTTLDDVVGQQHLIGAGKPLRLAIESRTPRVPVNRYAWCSRCCVSALVSACTTCS